MVTIGKKAPALKLPNQDDDVVSLADFAGRAAKTDGPQPSLSGLRTCDIDRLR